MSTSTLSENQKAKSLPRQQSEVLPTPPDSSDSSSEESLLTPIELPSTQTDIDFPLPPSGDQPITVLNEDAKTPDSWLPRDPRLIRLTGNHPFNVEAPLSDLYDQGFLTSPELFYVRNHGAVPRVEDENALDWELSIEGLVEKPFKITLRQLIKRYEQRTYPITLVCAGNRRKEQNVVRKSKGFNWGAAGLSTALFTGPMMADVLKAAKPIRGARYVCMEGADELPSGCYATSVKLNWAMDPNKGFMLAHRMNGEVLRPDHGKPLRVVIPGQIGGRSVKWLKRIILTREPSDNWYHIYDNRVLPIMISPEIAANEPSWWTDERYAIYDLSPNSAIAYPAHNEALDFSDEEATYEVRGYAYAGGGRRVTRVELSLDKGRTWRLAAIDYAEDKYRDAQPTHLYGGLLDMAEQETCFCWCFWSYTVSVAELRHTEDLVVRAMDEGMCVQPRDMYWNVMGMMNNPWFRLAVHKDERENCLRFEHPTQPALYPGGWMERVKKEGGDISNGYWGEQIGDEASRPVVEDEAQQISMTNPEVKDTISFEQLREHEIEDAPWFVVEDQVYDGTSFLKEHPGGAQSIAAAAGQDVTEEFVAIHSETAKAMMKDYHIGTLDERSRDALLNGERTTSDSSDSQSPVFLERRNWKKAILHSKSNVSRNTRLFTFKLDHEDQQLGLPVGQHILMKLRDPATREVIIRPYTPISSPNKRGFVDVLIKVYFDTEDRKGGKMSQAMEAIPTGHAIEIKGPLGKFEYLGSGKCKKNESERHVKTFIMISGGTGITPIYQLLSEITTDAKDETKCILLNSNHKVEDILCNSELDAFATSKKNNCEIHCTLTQPPDDWKALRGRIDGQMLKKFAGRSSFEASNVMVLVCGPGLFEKSVHNSLLDDGWTDEDIVFF